MNPHSYKYMFGAGPVPVDGEASEAGSGGQRPEEGGGG